MRWIELVSKMCFSVSGNTFKNQAWVPKNSNGCQVPALTEQRLGPLCRASEQKSPDLNISLVFFSWQQINSIGFIPVCCPLPYNEPGFPAGLQMRLSNWPH